MKPSAHRRERRRARPYRRKVVAALGGFCACCGEVARVATIDHVRNDGAEARRRFPDLRDYYRAILAEGCPPDRYQLLCLNCHESKNERGECHHQAEARALLGLAA